MAAAVEAGPLGTGIAAANWLTKLLSVLKKLTSRLTISSNKAPTLPVLPISASTAPSISDFTRRTVLSPRQHQQQPEYNNLHPIINMMREQELGRAIITLAVPVATAMLISGDGKLLVAHVVVVGLMTGCMSIWNGILFRTTFPRLANVLEQVGISIVLLLVYGLVASFLPKGFAWFLWLSGALCLLPFVLAIRETAEIPG